MKSALPLAASVALIVSTPLTGCAQPKTDARGATLFDGETLDGWAPMFGGTIDAWEARDGEIRVIEAGRGGWLRTVRTYRDFELTFDFIIPEGGNSGVGLRCTSVGDPAFTGFEVQILDSHGEGSPRRFTRHNPELD